MTDTNTSGITVETVREAARRLDAAVVPQDGHRWRSAVLPVRLLRLSGWSNNQISKALSDEGYEMPDGSRIYGYDEARSGSETRPIPAAGGCWKSPGKASPGADVDCRPADEVAAKHLWERLSGSPYAPEEWAPCGKTMRLIGVRSGRNSATGVEWVTLEFVDDDGVEWHRLFPNPQADGKR